MTQKTDPAGGPHHQGHFKGAGLDSFYETLRKPGIVRPRDNRWFAGVASGIAYRLGVDPLVVRAGFILFGLFFGTGIALYLVLWLLMQDDRGRLPLEQALKYGEGGPIFLLVVAAISVVGGVPWDGDVQGPRLGGLVVLGVLGYLFFTRSAPGRDLLESIRAGVSSAGPTTSSPASPATGAPAGVSTGNAAANAGASAATLPPPVPAPPVWGSPSAPRARSKVVGFAPGLLILGLSVVAAAVMAHLANTHGWQGHHLAVGVAAGLGVLGLGIAIVGVVGRRSGWLAPFAIFGAAASLALSVFPASIANPWQVGEHKVTVTTLSATNDYEFGVGEFTLDLGRANHAATADPDHVTATLGLGELILVLPDNAHVVVNAKARAGEFVPTGTLKDTSTNVADQSGTSLKHTYEFGPKDAPVAMTVDAEVGLGQITMMTESDR